MKDLNNLLLDMPALETPRLVIRPFRAEDLDDIHRVLDGELGGGWDASERRGWLDWSALNASYLPRLYQPPFGDRAVALKDGGRLIGACGLAPAVAPLGLLNAFQGLGETPRTALTTVEVGLYYALTPAEQGKGYATEAARALLEYGFDGLRLARIIATTTYENVPSQRVMQRLGMRLEKNRFAEPAWLQIVGILENPHR